MSRIRIDLPDKFTFTTSIPVRITDVNYGGHVGNDTVLSIIHEARMQFLKKYGFEELKFGGVGMIMADVGIEFKSELFYGDVITASVAIKEFGPISFDIFYKLEKDTGSAKELVALAKTGMVCFDYDKKKIVRVPASAKQSIPTLA